MSAHERYNALLEDEASVKEDEWLDEIDNQLFSFQRKITCSFKNAEGDTKSKGSSRSSRSLASKTLKGSKASKESRSSRGSKSFSRRRIKIK